MISFFTQKYRNKSDKELHDIASSTDYQDEAIYAAILELELRNSDLAKYEDIKGQLKAKFENKADSKAIETNLVSKKVIWLVGFLLHPIFAGIPYIMNLITVKQYRFIWEVIIYLLVFTTINIYVFSLFDIKFGVIIVSNALGTAILSEIFWKRHLRSSENYKG